MPESIMLQHYLRRSHLAEELAISWSPQADGPEQLSTVEAIVSECLQLRDTARIACKNFYNQLFDQEFAKESQHSENVIRLVLDSCLRTFATISRFMNSAEAKHCPSESLAAFAQAHDEVRRLQKEFNDTLPPFNPELTRQALAELEHGEGQFAEDILANLQGQNPTRGQ